MVREFRFYPIKSGLKIIQKYIFDFLKTNLGLKNPNIWKKQNAFSPEGLS